MKYVLATLVTLIAVSANAMIWFEPMVSYEASGTTAVDFTTAGKALKGVASDNGTSLGAVNYGARLGWLGKNQVWFAGEYMAASGGKIKYNTREDEFERESIGADLGVWLDRWNLWVGYNFTDKLKVTPLNATQQDEITGTAIRVGIGYILARHLAFNVEGAYRTYNEGKSVNDTTLNDFPTYIDKFTQTTVSAGFSFPF
ncbi:hypothetical protein [Bdellovibrio sp. KM01]|uniref:hypothetical protein n=1 Tax=Bdellovibrio sp. KM01 TaxID=2748865 RepID=UPI0015EA8D71|nr:hypothetical protein [Bdellovibrio sp. KM01]QLY26598.1 hypothetical protein HW988_06155 [Bdellovibrio sp. KM01]